MVGKYSKFVGELYEKSEEWLTAIEFYNQSVEAYESENNNATTISLLERMAYLYIKENSMELAIETYIKLIGVCNSRSMIPNKYVTMLTLCELDVCVKNKDLVKLSSILNTNVERYYAFESSREYELCKKCIEAIKNNDQSSFTEAASNYDDHSGLDDVQVKILVGIKQTINNDIDDIC